ncbi:hypothetical protein [Aliikangiella coralliicola]|uniref:GHMP family kinase ATP-binding protein n=1 Tax=Aliikangiella coralliicola TaxID=2592383 RepID=UPI00143DBD6D|nr:hypothetical protein [Aliikangiella coralliicola]
MEQVALKIKRQGKKRAEYSDKRTCSRDIFLSGKQYVGVCRGALGELFQGPALHVENEIAIISSLIPKYSWAYFSPSSTSEENTQKYYESLRQNHLHRKSIIALDHYCNLHNVALPDGHWEFSSQLQVARGMASSTADIVAILRCAAKYFNRTLTIHEILIILSKIERSDSVFLNELALFCSSRHEIIQQFNHIPPLYALYIHEDETVCTDNTKSILNNFYEKNRHSYKDLYRDVVRSFNSKDIKTICQLSSQSAELSQGIFPKQYFSSLVNEMKSFNADGIIVAHTGSVIGYLFCERPGIQLLEEVSMFFKSLQGNCQFTEING